MNSSTASGCYASPVHLDDAADCIFYHTMDLPISGTVQGDWDLRGRFEEYVGYVDLSGKTVLDVGTASGFLAFEAEKAGASVVGVDVASSEQWNRLSFPPARSAQRLQEPWKSEAENWIRRMKGSWWLAHRELNSSNRAHYGNIYAIPRELGMFDVAIVAQILVHLQDVIGALTSVANRCSGTMVIAEGMIDADTDPFSQLLMRADNPDADYNYWHHSTGLLTEIMTILGFERRSKAAAKYCQNVLGQQDVEITTLVFDRVSAANPDT